LNSVFMSKKTMKLAVLADIHSNLVALQAAAAHVEAWKPDQVIVAGDIVNRGARPRECLEFIFEKERTQGWLTLRGNHEDYVISQARPDSPRRGPAVEVHRGSRWTLKQLEEDVSALEATPFQQSLLTPDGYEARVVHASMRGKRDGIFPDTCDETLREQIAPPPSLICVGHTHVPLVRMIDQTLVVNAGSVGLPFDRDPRLAYAQLTWRESGWQAAIVRLDYDRITAEQDLFDSGFMEDAGPLARIVQLELRQARSLLFGWASKFQTHCLAGEISMEDSVQKYLGSNP
jgi:predicted phosphodiesterase